MAALDPDSRDLFAGPNYAHVATLMPDGSPHSVPVWIDVEDDDRLVFYKEDDSVAIRNIKRDPRVAISILDYEDPYRSACIRGVVVEFRQEPVAREWLRERAVPYTGELYPEPLPGPGTLVVVLPERVKYHYVGQMRHVSPSASGG
jgi:PPOX class probable F420-dependent enzyme